MSTAAASLVIASRNRPDLLSDSVASVLAGAVVPAQVIVVDQSDAPHPVLRRARGWGPLEYVWSRSVGLSRANNLGWRSARHEAVLFTHDDVLVDRAWAGTLLEALAAAGPSAAVTGRVLPADGAGNAADPGHVRADVVAPSNLAIGRATLAALGGFDERLGPGTDFPGAEDHDLGFRLLEHGGRIVFEPAAVVRHRAPRQRGEQRRQRYAHGRGQGAFYGKHLDLRDPSMLGRLADDVVGRLLRWPLRSRKEGRRLADELAYVRGVLGAVAAWRRGDDGRPGAAPSPGTAAAPPSDRGPAPDSRAASADGGPSNAATAAATTSSRRRRPGPAA